MDLTRTGLYILEHDALSDVLACYGKVGCKIGMTIRSFQERIANINGVFTDEEKKSRYTISGRYGAINEKEIDINGSDWKAQATQSWGRNEISQKALEAKEEEIKIALRDFRLSGFQTEIIYPKRAPQNCIELFSFTKLQVSSILSYGSGHITLIKKVTHNSPTHLHGSRFYLKKNKKNQKDIGVIRKKLDEYILQQDISSDQFKIDWFEKIKLFLKEENIILNGPYFPNPIPVEHFFKKCISYFHAKQWLSQELSGDIEIAQKEE